MNAATAGGLLGGDVSGKFVARGKAQDEGQCEFARVSNPAIELRIEVRLMKSPATEFPGYLSHCGSNPKALKAIGNEAVLCTLEHKQRVVGRVRDQAFVITLTGSAEPDSPRKAADIVAGNLF